MAISANSVWEVRTAGSDTNGGGFVTGSGGTDYSQQNAKNTAGNNISTTDAVANGTTTVTSATAAFTSAIVGNLVYFTGGTGAIAAQWRQVTAFNSATSITIDATIAASTGMTMNVGGALVSPGQASLNVISGNIVWIANGTYTISSSTANISGGKISTLVDNVRWFGYNAARGDVTPWSASRPTIKAGVNSITMFAIGNNLIGVRDLILDGDIANRSGISGLTGNGQANVRNAQVKGCGTSAFNMLNAVASFCEFSGTASTPVAGQFFACYSHDNTGGASGFSPGSGIRAISNCVAANNSGHGFNIGSNQQVLTNCTAYNNTAAGISCADGVTAVNCVLYKNGTYGLDDNGNASVLAVNCAFGANTTAATRSLASAFNLNPITLSADPFTNAAGADFSLNANAGGGALVRGAGYGTVGSSAGLPDAGAIQSKGGGGSFPSSELCGGF